MSTSKLLLRSFAGGEITPEMYGRLDLGKFQTGVQLARNFRSLAHGPMTRRPGTRYINAVKDSSQAGRLIAFAFSATQSTIIELGNFTARFHTGGGTELSAGVAITAITQANPGAVTATAHGRTTGDGVYVSGVGGMTTLNGQFYTVDVVDANTVRLRYLDGTLVDTSAMAAFTSGGTLAAVYTITTPWPSSALSTLVYSQDADVLTLTCTGYPTQEIRRLGSANWSIGAASFTPTLAAPTGVTCTATKPTPTNVVTQSYVVTTIGSDGITESVASSAASDTNNLSIFGNFNTISWSAVSGASRYYVYKLRGGSYGYIGQTTGTSLIDDNILPDTTQTPPQNFTSLNASAGNYPAAVAHFEQRRWLGGTANAPQSVWGTRSGTDSNLTSSVPSRDDDALSFRIKAQQQNAIRHLVPLNDLVALTVGGEFRIFADPGPSITPGSLAIKPQSFAGAAAVQPALTDSSALYVQARGSRIRELSYDPQGLGSYKSLEASLFAPHLFDGYQIVELAYTRAPDQTLWAVRSDGALLGLTYVPDQQVYGWHQHVTDGAFESCAVVPEGGEDALYVLVRRTIGGATRRYIERMQSRLFTELKDAFYVDSGLTYDGAATTTISGLRHLEGETVAIFADGAVAPSAVVTGGQVTLDVAASTVHVGLPFTSDLQTLPAQFDAPAQGQGTMKNVNAVHIRVTQSSLVKAGPTFARLTDYPARAVSDPYGSPPAFRVGELRLAINGSWNTDGSVCLRQDTPAPLTVLAIAMEHAVGG